MTFSTLTYKQKYHLVLASSILLLGLVYELGLKKTAACLESYHQAREQASLPVVTEFDWDVLRQKEKLLDRIAQAHCTENQTPDKELLAAVSTYTQASGVTLEEFPAATLTRGEEDRYTNKVVLEGGFVPLLEVVYMLEGNAATGRVTSVAFRSFFDFQTGATKLRCTLYIQNLLIPKNNHETS